MQRRHLQDFVPVMGRTADGVRVKLTGNLSDLGGLERIVSSLEGIGLVRTELLLPPDDHLNDLAAQRVVYSAIADSLRGDQSVVYRVFDYTSEDKKELAPTSPVRQFGDMLHQRGLELQLLAMVDACRGRGELSVLFPRIEDPESMRENAALLRNARDTISNRDELLVRAGAQIESRLGITALKSILQGGDVVFIAVGSNDLAADIQRIDRGRDELNHSDPDLLRALAQIAETVKETAEEIGREIPLGLCGGIASVPLYTPMLLGLGYREFSVSGMAAHQVDSVIGKVSIEQCTTLVQHLLELDDSDAITRELERFSQKIQS
jgi:phosphoenolpyruvate-protein kinase (PTS system EI component)